MESVLAATTPNSRGEYALESPVRPFNPGSTWRGAMVDEDTTMRRITRSQATEELREVLLRMVDQHNSLCRVAAWRGIFCRGFSQWSRAELEQRFPSLERDPALHRGHLELQANRCQLARQDIRAGRLPCDVTPGESSRPPCEGWSEFDERELARFHREICGERVEVLPDWAGPHLG